jgi:hypothetical protein
VAKLIKGKKRHVLVDTQGLLLHGIITAHGAPQTNQRIGAAQRITTDSRRYSG